jgi:predicted alpha/beta superfamily hydrolase
VSAPTVRRHAQFHSAHLPDDRDVTVYLPPGYEASRASYPVLYMQDGQNLFDPKTAFKSGEHWRLGETADALIAERRLAPLVIVGIANTGTRRIHEYTPTADQRLGGGLADRYCRLIVEDLKPFIDATYRTRREAGFTAVGGSSLGGLVSLYLGLTRPDVFGAVAAMSPSVWWDRRTILKTIRLTRPRPTIRIWADMGTSEGRRALDDARLLKAALVGAGWTAGTDLHYAEYEGATHSEQAWGDRVGRTLAWLFPGDAERRAKGPLS